jgi:hypothetical protein
LEPSALTLILQISQAQEAFLIPTSDDFLHFGPTANLPRRRSGMAPKLTVINFNLFDAHIQ